MSQANSSAIVGQTIFTLLSIFQLILICFIAPGFTAGQISLEREKQTLDLLVSTPMRPGAIVLGKLLAALAFVVLMIVAAVPITAIVLMYGGASVDDIVRQQLVLLATAVALGAIGLFFSALLKRTQAATVLSYITMLALTVGTVMLFGFWTLLINQDERLRRRSTQAGAGAAAVRQSGHRDARRRREHRAGRLRRHQRPAGPASRRDAEFRRRSRLRRRRVPAGGPVWQSRQSGRRDAASGYWWPRIAITFVGLAALLTFLSTRLVVPAGMRWAFRRRRPAGAAGPIGVEEDNDPAQPTVEDLGEGER